MDYNTSEIILGPGRNRQGAKAALARANFLGQLERHVLLWVLDQAPGFKLTVAGIQNSCAISESTWVRLRKKLEGKGILNQTRVVDRQGASHWGLEFDLRVLWEDRA
jgi:hypothetical protein